MNLGDDQRSTNGEFTNAATSVSRITTRDRKRVLRRVKRNSQWRLKISWRSSSGNSTNDREGDTGESHVVCIYDSSSRRGFNNTSFFPDQTRVRKVKLGFDSGYAEDRGVEWRSDFMAVIGLRGRDIKCNREFFNEPNSVQVLTDGLFSWNDHEPRFNFLNRSKRGSYLARIVTGTRIDYSNPGHFRRRERNATLAWRERGFWLKNHVEFCWLTRPSRTLMTATLLTTIRHLTTKWRSRKFEISRKTRLLIK